MPTAPDHGWKLQLRIVGSGGVIEIGATGWDSLRYRNAHAADWVELLGHWDEDELDGFARAFGDIAESLDTGKEPELSARKALRATELIFATYHSAQFGGRIDLPFTAEDQEIYAW